MTTEPRRPARQAPPSAGRVAGAPAPRAAAGRTRRRPHPAIGARWMTLGLAVSTTVGMTAYLEIDAYLHSEAAGAGTASAAPPVTPATAAPTLAPTVPPPAPPTLPPVSTVPSRRPGVTAPAPGRPSPTVATRPRIPVTVPPSPTIVVTPRTVPSLPAPSTHAGTRGSNP